ncbi:hypothetical protein RvY_06491 [Ramazzottius varieornatus]|uniref:Uncharacterized protein n=1 Tax=Ramazzottius varieornatus TaxID=947166 RepID=A0A1D1V486_RAMVA|nr:hypothetical protein RvY_06491 [Ramazzottius varieornatus]
MNLQWPAVVVALWSCVGTMAQLRSSGPSAPAKACSLHQDATDLDCPCRFRELPCRVPGSVCTTGFVPGGAENELRCQCAGMYNREMDRYCVEKPMSDLDRPVVLPVEPLDGTHDLDLDFGLRAGPKKKKPKRPSAKNPPFRTVMVTSNPLSALPVTMRPFHKPNYQNGMGVGMESPALDTSFSQRIPKPASPVMPTLPPPPVLTAKNTGFVNFSGFHKGVTNKRPTKSPRRTTRALPRADGSMVVNGWYPDIWPAVGLNYSI